MLPPTLKCLLLLFFGVRKFRVIHKEPIVCAFVVVVCFSTHSFIFHLDSVNFATVEAKQSNCLENFILFILMQQEKSNAHKYVKT